MTRTKGSRFIAMLLAVIMVFSAMPMTALTANAATASGNTTEFAGGSGTEEDPYLISTKYHLDNVRNYLSSSFRLINDIEFTEADFSEDGDFYNYGVCWKPIGDSTNKFTGKFDGNNFEIRNLQINKKNSDYVGLFGYIYNGGVSNLHLVNVDIEGKNHVGSLCGYLHSESIKYSNNVKAAYIESCYASGNVLSYGTYSGGLCGYMDGIEYYEGAPGGSTYRYADASIKNSINESNVTGGEYSGGIVGYASSEGCEISSCINNGKITAITAAGGILGYSNGRTGSGWSQSGLSGPVTMRYYFEYAILKNCINKGNIGASKCGGIIGEAYYTTYGTSGTRNGAINSYSIGKLTGDTVGGIIPCKFTGEIKDSFYLDTSANTYSTSYGTSVSASDLKIIDTFTAWDFNSIWTMAGDKSYKYPELQCFTLKGSVVLNGIIAYKDTITPNITGINNAYSELSYDWYIDNVFVHTGKTYTVAGSDVGKTLKVKATSTHPMSLGGVESAGYSVVKASQTAYPEVPELKSKTAFSFEITTVSTQEYSIDNVNWQTTGVFENLDPDEEYTVYSRILENDLYLLGESTDVLTVATESRSISGTVSISGTPQYGKTLTADVSGVMPADATFAYEWRANGVVIGTGSTYTVTEEDIGKGIILVLKGSDDYIGTLSSAPVSATKANAQDPSAPVIKTVTNTSIKLIEKKGYEYSLDKINWQDSTVFEGLSAATTYTFYQRIKETDTAFASKTSTGTNTTTLKNTVNAPEKPVVEKVTNTSVTLKAIVGYEYSMDGFTWQKSNVFNDLSPYTEYAFCQRIAETSTDYASAQSGYTVAITLKNTITDHKYGSWTKVNDITHKHTCSVCAKEETANHTWNGGSVTKPASCKENGVKTYTCTACNAIKTESIAKTTTHSYGNWTKVNDTTHKHTCSVCSKEETANHTWNSGTVTKKATCKETGVKTYTCTACNATKTESIAKLTTHIYDHACDTDCNVCGATRTITHNYKTSWSKDKTNHWHECSVCKGKKDVVAHTPGAEATETTAQSCTTCGYVIKAALGHKHNYATTWTTDETGHWYACSGCEEKSNYAAHDFENDCDKDCSICGFTRETEHKFAEAWTSDATNHWHECSGCGLKQDEAAHEPGAEATETTAQTCTICGYEIAPALGAKETESATTPTVPANPTKPNEPADDNKGGFPIWIPIVIVVVIAGAGAAYYFFIWKKKN